jgi:hypothetical protein
VRGGACRYDAIMTTLMTPAVRSSAAAPVYAAVPPTSGGLPAGLTDVDAARIRGGDQRGPRRVHPRYAHARSRYARWCAARDNLPCP